MNLNSPLFDRIRVKPAEDPTAKPEERRCDHAGCVNAGQFRAPKGRGREGQFFHFCLDHVRAYNQRYNYFAGMPEPDISAFQKDALTGHRPTWRMGTRAAPAGPERARREHVYADPFDVFGAAGFDPRRKRPAEPAKPKLGQVGVKAFDTLSLEPGAAGPEIKARYKELVKRLHPDANGGDRSREGFLQEVIKAYNTLRSLGFV